MRIAGWAVGSVGEPLIPHERNDVPGDADVLIEVAGCGICHTDLGFLFDGVPTRHDLPLVLGHEVSGRVVEAGGSVQEWVGRNVIVPAVIPCSECDACRAGQGSICPRQVFPGNDVHGGFASHLIVPAAGLCPVPDSDTDLASLSVIADAVSTPYQALHRAGVTDGDLAIFVGAGGVGGFGIQIAAASGATVIALDIDDSRLETISQHGASLTLNTSDLPFKEVRKTVRDFARKQGVPTWRQKIFETSGSVAGQSTAFGLVPHGGYLGIIGYTAEKVTLRLSNLMALHATAQGNWGCLPEHYPSILSLVQEKKIQLDPFVEKRPLALISEAIDDVRAHRVSRRIVLVPEH